MRELKYVDASQSPDDRTHYPQIVSELRDLGFEPVGRVVLDIDLADAQKVAKDYPPGDHEFFLDNWDIPISVLRSADRSTYVEVSWFWYGPSLRFWSRLSDGSLVETQRRWDDPPALPKVLRRVWKWFPIEREMTRADVPGRGRSIEVPFGTQTARLWDAHRAHLSRYASERNAHAAEHENLGTYLEIATRALRHEHGVMRRLTRIWLGSILVLLAVVVAVSAVAFATRAGAIALWVTLGMALVGSAAVRAMISRFRWLPRSWRPHFR